MPTKQEDFDQLKSLILNEEPVIPFFKELNKTRRTKLGAPIRAFHNEMFERHSGKHYGDDFKHSVKSRELFKTAFFLTANQSQWEDRFWNDYALSNEVVNEILPWYKPVWYEDFLLEKFKHDYKVLDYNKLMAMTHAGLIEPSNELIAIKVDAVCYEEVEGGWYNISPNGYNYELLHNHPETISEHFWLMFQYPCRIYYPVNDDEDESIKKHKYYWTHAIKQLLEDDKIDRQRLIKECVQTGTKGFSEKQSMYYWSLLNDIETTDSAYLACQDDLFVSLNSEQNEVVKTVLKLIKKLCSEDGFDTNGFLNEAPVLLSSKNKTIVSSTSIILEKLISIKPESVNQIAEVSLYVFALNNEKVQERVAKMLQKQKDEISSAVIEQIPDYKDSILYKAKVILDEFVGFESEEEIAQTNHLNEAVAFEEPQLIDQYIFIFTQALEANAPHHVDLLFGYMPKFFKLIDADTVLKLQALFKRTFDTIYGKVNRWPFGTVELIAAVYLHDVYRLLFEKYPFELAEVAAYKQALDKEADEANNRKWADTRLKPLRQVGFSKQALKSHRRLALKSLDLIQNNHDLTLLSCPTHEPAWVSLNAFAQRLSAYIKADVYIDTCDLQIAIMRLKAFGNEAQIASDLEQVTDAEVRSMLAYTLGFTKFDITSVKSPNFWISSVAKSKNIEDLNAFEARYKSLENEVPKANWYLGEHKYTVKEYDPSKRQRVDVIKIDFVLKYDFATPKTEDSFAKELRSLYKTEEPIFCFLNELDADPFFETMSGTDYKYYNFATSDLVKLHLLAPNHTAPYLVSLIRNLFRDSATTGKEFKKTINELLQIFSHTWQSGTSNEQLHVFLACSLVCGDAVCCNMAAELWVQKVQENVLDPKMLGNTLGRLMHHNYAPLKRFTDVVSEHLLNAGAGISNSLFTTIETMIMAMPNEPQRTAKTLVETYIEFYYRNKAQLNTEVTEQLKNWSSVKSIKKVVDGFLKKI